MKILPRIAKAYRIVEYVSIYGILIGIILLELLSFIFVDLTTFLSKIDLLLVIILVLLLIFRYLDEKLGFLEKLAGPKYCDEFSEAMNAIFTHGEQVKTIDFFGLSSWFFQPSLETRGVRAKRVRILLRNPKQVKYLIPSNSLDQEKIRNQVNQMLDAWKAYHEGSFISHLQIRFYDFEPLFFGVIVDKKKGFIGFYRPIENFPSFRAMTCFVLTDGTAFERKILRDFEQWFNDIFKGFSLAGDPLNTTPKST